MIHYTATLFVGAFLLLQMQPPIAKQILPWFNCEPSVWTAWRHASVTKLVISSEVSELGIVATHLVVDELSNRDSDPDFDRLRKEVFEDPRGPVHPGLLEAGRSAGRLPGRSRELGGDADGLSLLHGVAGPTDPAKR